MDKYIEKMVQADAVDQIPAPQDSRKVYIVTYKESEPDNGVVVSADRVDCGLCEYAYASEGEAKKQMWELSDDKMNELLNSFDEGDFYRDCNDAGDYVKVQCGDATYEYSVQMVTVQQIEGRNEK